MAKERVTRTEIRKAREVQNNSKTIAISLLSIIIVLTIYFSVLLWYNFIELSTSNMVLPIILLIGGIALVVMLISQMNKFKFNVERQTTDTISKTEGRFKALIQNSLDVITIVDLKGRITYQSPSTERVLGYDTEELMGESLFELIHTEDHPLVQNAIDQKATTVFSYRIQHKDGTWLFFESAGTNLAANPLVGGFVINSRDITDRKREQEEKRQKEIAALKFNVEREQAEKEKLVAEREKLIIEESKAKLEEAFTIIEHKNHEITDSINYAFRIQTALLPDIDNIKTILPNSFVFWRPKDIVSGDFYWFNQIDNDRVLILCADCTGHGVPGAFMTMIGNTLLNQIVKTDKIYQPDEILNRLHTGVRKGLKQDQEGSKSRDGMDLAMVMIDTLKMEAQYAGANRPFYLFRNGEIEEYKADKMPIGGLQTEVERRFTNNVIQLQRGDSIYTFSDGYPDQFGGDKGRKFMTKKLKELFVELATNDHHMSEQRDILEKYILDWMGTKYEQIDDILVMGVKI